MKPVLLHALPFDGRMWRDTGAALGIDVLAPDLFPLGDSIEAWASAVLDQVAHAAPDRVTAIVLVGAKSDVRPEPHVRDEAIHLLETQGIGPAWDRYWLPLFADVTSSSVIETARSWAMDQDVGSIVNGVRAFHDRRDLSTFVAAWNKPLIGISGDRDVAPDPTHLRRLATGPNRTFHLVADCGHYVNLEQPATFSRLLDAVISELAE